MKDEFEFIDSIKPETYKQPSLHLGIGDDAAVYQSLKGMREVVCLDTMIEGIHFTKDTLSAEQIGRKALAINISDLAAMGAMPKFYLVSIAIPATWRDEEVTLMYQGMNELANLYQMDLIGGDTVSAKESLVLTVTAIGQVEEHVALYRNQARPGDIVFVTGSIGTSAAGLELLLDRGRFGSFTDNELELVKIHQEPQPQIEAGRLFARFGRRMSLNDISDGLASEAHEIAEASGVSIYLKENFIPFHSSLRKITSFNKALEYACNGGEDFQLIGTIAEEDFGKLKDKAEAMGLQLTVIGEVRSQKAQPVYMERGGTIEPLLKNGFNHFT